MGPLVLIAAVTLGQVCYAPRDTSPGWKQVTLPVDGPALAAPEGVAQFRSDDAVEVVDDHPGAYLAGAAHDLGRTGFTFTPPDGACALEVSFKDPLRGAKVDVTAWGAATGTMALLREDRVAGYGVKVGWGDHGVQSVTVVVHNHLRDRPIVERWRVTCRVPAARLQVTDAFRLPHSLYYLQPAGRSFALCNQPRTPMRVSAGSVPVGVIPSAVAVKRE